ncbi:MAG: HAMP domain-containing histidine kinase [Lachnospiraceae bacterium]|nr:HAMP domain-containing histidine kinase [Lachnospiraceae bacterium]
MYIKRVSKWIICIMAVMFMSFIVMYLNDVRMEDIGYGILLVVFLCIVIFMADYINYWKKCRELSYIAKDTKNCIHNLPVAEDVIEQNYTEIILGLWYEMTNELSRQVESKKDMMEYYSVWVHQIKTPIAAMHLLITDIDGENLKQTKDLERQLFDIEEYVEMALSYMRINSDTTDYVIINQPVDDIVREAIRKYSKTFIHKKIHLKYEGISNMAVTDKKWLGFVIGQLLSNALKYTKSGGSITIYMENDKLVIEDTGIGISKEDIPRIFEKGYTGYNGHNNRHSSGIGLYLCKVILTRLSHTIDIESEPDVGTKVKIGLVVQD